MANLKELRTRITSIISTRQITSAMKMVSAARLRKAQDAIVQIRPYATKLHEILTHLASSIDVSDDNIYADQREANKVLIVVVTSNRGLCGGFNSNVIKRTLQLANTTYSEQLKKGNLDFITIGKKGDDVIKKHFNVIAKYNEVFDGLDFNSAAHIAENVMKRFEDKEYDKIEIVYNKFKNAAVQILETEQFLPIELESEEIVTQQYDYIFEPSKDYIVEDLIPKSLKIQFFKALLDSFAAEHGARMTAMHKATDNATDIVGELKLIYNRARQDAITNEILEIVSGANALKG